VQWQANKNNPNSASIHACTMSAPPPGKDKCVLKPRERGKMVYKGTCAQPIQAIVSSLKGSRPVFASHGVPNQPKCVVRFPSLSCQWYPYNNPRPGHRSARSRLLPRTRTPTPALVLSPVVNGLWPSSSTHEAWLRLSSAISSPSWWRLRPQLLQPSSSSLVASLGHAPRPLRRSSPPPPHPVLSRWG
jgi:hypothetical protein